MKKKIWVLGAIAVSAALTFNCKKGGSDADAKAAVAEVNKMMTDSIAPLEAAADGAAAAKIVGGVSAAMEAAMAKYPQLKGEVKSAEIKAEMDKGGEAAVKFLTTVATLSEKFKDSAELKAAADKLMSASQK